MFQASGGLLAVESVFLTVKGNIIQESSYYLCYTMHETGEKGGTRL